MRLYTSSTLHWGKDIDSICSIAKRAQFEGIELWAEQIWFSKMTVRDIRKALKRYQLKGSFHAASWDLNICSLNDGIRAQSIEQIKRSFDLAVSIGSSNVTVHPGKRTLSKEWTPWHEKALQTSLDELEKSAIKYGITMSLELMEEAKKEFVTSAESIAPFLENRSNYIQTTFDAAHISLNKSVLTEFHRMKRVNKIHLSDSTATQYHVALGEGDLKLDSFLNMIREAEYPVVLEGYDASSDSVLMKKHVRYIHNCLSRKSEEMTT